MLQIVATHHCADVLGGSQGFCNMLTLQPVQRTEPPSHQVAGIPEQLLQKVNVEPAVGVQQLGGNEQAGRLAECASN